MFEDGMYSDAEDEVEVEVEADAGEMATKEESLPDSGQAAPLEVAASFFFLSFFSDHVAPFFPTFFFFLFTPSFIPFWQSSGFVASENFSGSKEGMAYRMGGEGLGSVICKYRNIK